MKLRPKYENLFLGVVLLINVLQYLNNINIGYKLLILFEIIIFLSLKSLRLLYKDIKKD